MSIVEAIIGLGLLSLHSEAESSKVPYTTIGASFKFQLGWIQDNLSAENFHESNSSSIFAEQGLIFAHHCLEGSRPIGGTLSRSGSFGEAA